MHVSQAGDGFNLPLAKAVIICCWFLLKATISGSLAPSAVTALQLIQNKNTPQTHTNYKESCSPPPPASGKGGTIFISISDYHGLARHKAFFEHGTLRTLQISPRV